MIKSVISDEKNNRRGKRNKNTKTGHNRGLSNGSTLWLLCLIQLGIAGFHSTQNVVCPKHRAAFWHLYSHFYLKHVQELLTQYQKTFQKNLGKLTMIYYQFT